MPVLKHQKWMKINSPHSFIDLSSLLNTVPTNPMILRIYITCLLLLVVTSATAQECQPISSIEGSLDTDRAALEAIYNATGGDSWNWPVRYTTHNWMSDKPLNEWAGVHVENNRVTHLLLPNKNLVGALPPNIGSLTALRKIDVHRNSLTEIPQEVGALVALEDVHLAENQLRAVPASMCNLINMKELHLDYNKLEGELPAWIFNLTALERLTLGHNLFEGYLPVAIGNLVNLTVLYLHHNTLEGNLPGEAIGKLEILERPIKRINLTAPSLKKLVTSKI